MQVLSRIRNDIENTPHPPDRVLLRLGIVGFCFLMAYGSYWWHGLKVEYLNGLLATDRALIVYQEYSAGLLFAPVSLIAAAMLFLIRVLYLDVLKRRWGKVVHLLQVWLYLAIFVGLLLLLFGGVLVNTSWEKTFLKNGYSECPNFVLRWNKNFLNSAWVKDPQYCFDDQLHQILHENHSRKGFELASLYLERVYR